MIGKLIRIYRTRGLAGLSFAITARALSLLAGQARSFKANQGCFAGKCGIEIGGPSRTFTAAGIFPVYPIVGKLDNCTFGNVTVWEGKVEEGQTFQFDRNKPAGMQFIAEAAEMEHFPPDSYDFVLASHVLEHIANPIRALFGWERLLKNGGVLVLILPQKEKTFDHHRPVTAMEHLVADFLGDIKEDDLTHLPEILALHDLTRDPEAGDAEAFKFRSLLNQQNRCLHQHVFDARLVSDLADYVGMSIKAVETILPHHILVVAQKQAGDGLSATAS